MRVASEKTMDGRGREPLAVAGAGAALLLVPVLNPAEARAVGANQGLATSKGYGQPVGGLRLVGLRGTGDSSQTVFPARR